jgi:hypothetical protein
MIRIPGIALSLAMVLGLAACSKPEPEAPPPPQAAEATEEDPAASAPSADYVTLLSACNIDLREPNSIEWDTKWNPAFSRDLSQHPSGVRSAHWANAEDLATLQQMNRASPLEVSCGSDAGSEYSILIEMVAPNSTLADIPLQSGSYPIVATSAVKPGEIVVGNLVLNGSRFEARSGNLSLGRFDSEGAAGNFTIEGTEVGGENRPIRIEGTFDMPCRIENNQTECKSDKAERE